METINHECYVSPEVAKLLKDAGFDWGFFAYYDTNNILCISDVLITKESSDLTEHINCLAPTLDVAQRWLREIRHRSIEVKSFVDGTVENSGKWWIWHVYDFNPPIDWVLLMGSDRRYSTYEEALEAGIKKVLELILKKGE